MPEILVNVINKIPVLSGDVRQITANNGDYTVRLVFDDDWTDGEKTVLFVRENGFVYPAAVTKNDEVTVPAVVGVPMREWLYIGVKQGNVHTSRPCGIPVYRAITDMIDDDAVQPELSMWEDVLARVEALEKNGGGSGKGVMTGSGAPATATEAETGVLYMDTDTGYMYKCLGTDVDDAGATIYVWEPMPQVPVTLTVEIGEDYTFVIPGHTRDTLRALMEVCEVRLFGGRGTDTDFAIMTASANGSGGEESFFGTIMEVGASGVPTSASVFVGFDGADEAGLHCTANKTAPDTSATGALNLVAYGASVLTDILHTKEYTFEDVRAAVLSNRPVTLMTYTDGGGEVYGMYHCIPQSAVGTGAAAGIRFMGWRWVENGGEYGMLETGWVPKAAVLEEDGTLTITDKWLEGYAKQAAVDELSEAIADKVSSVNGNTPDENGNVTVEVGQPTDEQIVTAVETWLDEHPEATTTVADGSITPEKLSFYKSKPVVSTFADLDFSESITGGTATSQAGQMGLWCPGYLSESIPVDGKFTIINRSAYIEGGTFCAFAPIYYDADGTFIRAGNTAGTDYVKVGSYNTAQNQYFSIITYIPPENAATYRWYCGDWITDRSFLCYFDFADHIDHKPWRSDDVADLIEQNDIVVGNVWWNYQTDITNSIQIDVTSDLSEFDFIPSNYADILLDDNYTNTGMAKIVRIFLQAIDVRERSEIYMTIDHTQGNDAGFGINSREGVFAYDENWNPLTAKSFHDTVTENSCVSQEILEACYDHRPCRYLYKITVSPEVKYLIPAVTSLGHDTMTNPEFIRIGVLPFNPRYTNAETVAFEAPLAVENYIASKLRPDYYKFRQIGRLVPNGNCNYVAWNHNTLHYDATRNVYVMTMRGSNVHGGDVNNAQFVKIDPVTLESSVGDIVVGGVTANWVNGFTIDDTGTYIMVCHLNDVRHYVTSTDGGATWVDGGEITVDVSATTNADTAKYDYTKFFNLHRLSTGTLLGTYDDTVSPVNQNYQFIARSVDGINWTLIEIPGSDNFAIGNMTACEMSFYEHDGTIMMIGRRNTYQHNITDNVTGESHNNAVKSYSYDDGATWTASEGSDSIRANAQNVSVREHDGIVELMAMNRDFSKYPRGYIYHYTATPEEALADRFTLREVFQCNAYGAGDVTGGGLAFDRYGRGLFVYSDNHGTNSNYDYLHFLYGAKADAPAVCADGVASEFLPYSGKQTQELIDGILSRLDALEAKV